MLKYGLITKTRVSVLIENVVPLIQERIASLHASGIRKKGSRQELMAREEACINQHADTGKRKCTSQWNRWQKLMAISEYELTRHQHVSR